MSIKYRPDIDGLRAIAVVSVVIYHFFPSVLPGGFIGVDIFFVISGYLITSILKKDINRNNYSIVEFYRRRIDRIFPSLIVVLCSAYVFGWYALFSDEYMQLGKLIAGGAAFAANIVLYFDSGYFDISSNMKPLLHLWSLGVEEQYYIFFPPLLYAFYKFKLKAQHVVSFVAIISLLLCVYQTGVDEVKAFYLPQYRVWELLAGSCLAMYGSGLREKYIINTVGMISLLVVILSLFLVNNTMPFPGFMALIPVLFSVIFIASGPDSFVNKTMFSNRITVYLGKISYPLYLWHWPVFSMAFIINGGFPSINSRLLLILVSLLLAVMTYHFIEKPLKGFRSWSFKTIPLFVGVGMFGVLGYLIFQNKGYPERKNVKVSQDVSFQMNGPLWQYTRNSFCLDKFHFERVDEMKWWFCMLSRPGNPEIMLLGNSYANHLYPGIAESGRFGSPNVLSIGTMEVIVSGDSGSIEESQRKFIDSVIKETPSIKYVIISGIDPVNYSTEKYFNSLKSRIDMIEESGKKVIVFYPHVKLGENIKACFARPFKSPDENCTTDLTEVSKLRKNFDVLKSRLMESNHSVKFFDPNSIICNDKECSLIKEGMPVYRDETKYFSVFASMKVGNSFADWAAINAPELLNLGK
ncbi:acyltransferase family protein [Buttiauxella noackiae]|uniref:acyltransferase family protein n=1 Tax=Buttiauxella noackiae TaxID=82992 RepID=UPI0028D19965|nr:acyltransferase family protein [Buttiauxella noackiae]